MKNAALLCGKRGYKRTGALIQLEPSSTPTLDATAKSIKSVKVEIHQASSRTN